MDDVVASSAGLYKPSGELIEKTLSDLNDEDHSPMADSTRRGY